ncbi:MULTISPECIES: hypothetical protein [Enterobacteriaceae]
MLSIYIIYKLIVLNNT